MSSDADVCAAQQYSSTSYFVSTSLNLDPMGGCDPTANVYQTTAIAMYECNNVVSVEAPVAGALSFDSSCQVSSGGKVSLQYNYYSDEACANLISYTTNFSPKDQECNVDNVANSGAKLYTNNYCVTDGNYQQYNPSGDVEVITDVWQRDGNCGGDMIQYAAVPISICFQTDVSKSSQYVTDGGGGYEELSYDTPNCEGDSKVVVDKTAGCSTVKPICDGSSSTFYEQTSLYFGPINGIGGDPGTNEESSSQQDLAIGLGVGLGGGLFIVCIVFYCYYWKSRKTSSLTASILDAK